MASFPENNLDNPSFLYTMDPTLLDDETKEYIEAFMFFDRDNDGRIQAKELGPVMRSVGLNPTDEMIQRKINELDYDGDGTLNVTEFIKMMEKEKKPEVESDLVNAWRVFDADDKGFIESRDLRRIINSMDDSIPKAEIQQLLLDADLTKDRRLTFEEFSQLLAPLFALNEAES